jgi:hypothetical protein
MIFWLHLSLKAVSTHDLMCMRTSFQTRIDKRIETFDCELRASEAHHRRASRLVLRLSSAQKGKCLDYRDFHDCAKNIGMKLVREPHQQSCVHTYGVQ